MPLSENEQRLLEQMERALYQEDPKFATSMRGSVRRASGGRLALAGLALVAGLVLLVLSVLLLDGTVQVLLGVLGFLVMMGGAIVAITGGRRSGPTGVVGGTQARPRPGQPGRTGSSKRGGGSFMQRMEQRWDRRKGGY